MLLHSFAAVPILIMAKNQRLREYPTGMSLAVPLLPSNVYSAGLAPPQAYPGNPAVVQTISPKLQATEPLYKAKFNPVLNEIVFDADKNPVRTGDWLTVICPSAGE